MSQNVQVVNGEAKEAIQENTNNWEKDILISEMSVDSGMPIKPAIDFVSTIIKYNGDIEKTFEIAEKNNNPIVLVGRDEFKDRFGKNYEDSDKAYDYYKSTFDIYNTYRKENPVKQYYTSRPFDGNIATGMGVNRVVTEQEVADMQGYLITNDNKVAPLSKHKDFGYLKLDVDDNGSPIWKEAKKDELIQAQQIRSVFGAKQMESTFLHSVGSGLWSGGVPTLIQAAAGGVAILGGTVDLIDGKDNIADTEKEYFKLFTSLMNYSNYISHTNEDEDKSLFDDFNAGVHQISSGVTQMAGIMLTSGISSIGLKSLGSVGVKIADKMIMKAGVQLSMTVGALEAAGPIYQELIENGFSASEAAIPAALSAGIVYASERVLGWNYVQKVGASFALNKYNKITGQKAIKEIFEEETGRVLKKTGVKSVKDLSANEKRGLIGNLIKGFSSARKSSMYEMLSKIEKGHVLKASLEEGMEEYIEGGGNVILFKGLNMLNKARSVSLLNEDENFTWNPKDDGSWDIIDNRTGDVHHVSSRYKEEYDNSLKLAEEVILGNIEFDESFDWSQGLAAAASTFITLGFASATGIIKNSEIKKRAIDMALYLAKNPDKEGEYEANLKEVIKQSAEIDQYLLKAVDQDVKRYLLLIKKYGIESETFKAAKNIEALSANNPDIISRKISRNLLLAYEDLDNLEELLKQAEEDPSVLKKNKNYNSVDDIKKAKEAALKNISYFNDKKNVELIDKEGKKINANYSQAFTDYYNQDALYTTAKNNLVELEALDAALGLSTEIVDGETESEYDKAYREALIEARDRYDKTAQEITKDTEQRVIRSLLSVMNYSNVLTRAYTVESNVSLEDMQKGNSSIATRYLALIDVAINKMFNSDINDDYDISNIKVLNELFSKFFVSAKGKPFKDQQSIIKEVFGNLKINNIDVLLDRIGTEFHGLQNISSSLMQDPIVASEIDALVKNAQAIYDMVPDDIISGDESYKKDDAFLGFDKFIKNGKALSIEGKKSIGREDLTGDQMEAVKREALLLSFNEIILDKQTIGEIINKANDIINNKKPISKSQAKILEESISKIMPLLNLYKAYIEAQNFFKEQDKNNNTKEHSAFSVNRDLELNDINDLRNNIKDIENTINNINNILSRVSGSYQKRAMRIRLGDLASKTALIRQIISSFGDNLDKDAVSKAEDVSNKIDAIAKRVEKQIPKEKQLQTVFDNLNQLYDDLSFSNKDEIKKIEALVFELQSAFVGYYDAFENGKLRPFIDYVKSRVKTHLTFNKAFGKGQVVDHSKPGLSGHYSPSTVIKGLDMIFNDGSPLNIGNNEDPVGLVQYLTSSFLVRMNSFGENGSNTYREVLNAYSEIIKKRRLFFGFGKAKKAYASSYEQYSVVVDIVGFLQNDAGEDKFSKDSLSAYVANVLNIRGYAGAGKTQQVLYEVLSVYQALGKGAKLRVKYVAPSDELITSFKASVAPLINNDVDIDSIVELSTTTLDKYLDKGKDNDGEFDIIIVDEASVIPASDYSLASKDSRFIDALEGNKKSKYLLVTDDSQVGGKDWVSPINIYDMFFEKTIPLVEVYRTGITQFKDYQEFIRDNRNQNIPFKLMETLTYNKSRETGGRYFSTEKEVIDQFVKYASELDSKTLDNVMLIAFDEQHKKRLLKENPRLVDYAHLIRTVLWENNKFVVSGLESNAVFVPINIDNNYINSSSIEYRRHYLAKVMLTAISRAKNYLVLVGNPAFSKEITTDVLTDNIFDVENTDSELSSVDNALALLQSELYNLSGIKEIKKKGVNEDKLETNNFRRGRLFNTERSKIKTGFINNFFKKFFGEDDIERESISIVVWDALSKEEDQSKEERDRKSAFKAAAILKAKFKKQIYEARKSNPAETKEDRDKQNKIDWEHRNNTIFKEMGIILKDFIGVEDEDAVFGIGNQLINSIELPSAFYDDLDSILMPGESIFNDKYKGRPFALRIAGWIGKGKTRKPIVDILDVIFGDKMTLTDYHKTRLAAYAKILIDKGIYVNNIQVAINQQLPGDGFNFNKASELNYTVEEINKGIDIGFIGDSKNLKSIKLERLFENERVVGVLDKFKSGDHIVINGKDGSYFIKEITMKYDGNKMIYNLHLNNSDNKEGIVISGTANELIGKVFSKEARKGDKFRKNPLLFSNTISKEEIVDTSWFPYFDGIEKEIDKENPYNRDNEDESKKIAKERRAVINAFRAKDYTTFNFVYHDKFGVLDIKTGAFNKFEMDNVITIELTDNQIKAISKELGYNKTSDFKERNLHVLTLLNTVDIGFKEKGVSQAVFASTDTAILSAANTIINNYNGESFNEFKSNFDEQLNFLFGDAFIDDQYADHIKEYNIYKMFRIAYVKSKGSVSGSFKHAQIGSKGNITHTGLILNNGAYGENAEEGESEKTPVNVFIDKAKKEGYEFQQTKVFGKGFSLVFYNKDIDESIDVFFHPEIANAQYIQGLIDSLDELKVADKGIDEALKKEDKKLRYNTVLELLKNTEAFQFIYSNKSNFTDVVDSTRIFLFNLGENIAFEQLEKGKPEKLLLKGSADTFFLHLRSALTKAKALSETKTLYRSTNKNKDEIAIENGFVRAQGIANPYLHINPEINIVGENTSSIRHTKKGKVTRTPIKRNILKRKFDITSDYAWRNNVSVDLVDSLESVNETINSILGDSGLDITEFVPFIPDNAFGELDNLRIKLLSKGNKSSAIIARHEAMHFIINHLISAKSRDLVLNQAKKEMVSKGFYRSVDEIGDITADEYIADLFMDGNYKKLNTETSLIKRFIDWVKKLLGLLNKHTDTLSGIMTSADDGYFRTRGMRNTESVFRQAVVDNNYTGIKALRTIEKYFGNYNIAQNVFSEFITNPAVIENTFLGDHLAAQNESLYSSISSYLSQLYEEHFENVPKEVTYPYIDKEDNRIKYAKISSDIIAKGEASEIFKAVYNVVTKDGYYAQARIRFFQEYINIVAFGLEKEFDEDTETSLSDERVFLLNSLIQSSLPGIDVESLYIDDESEGEIKAAVVASVIFRNPNKDSADFNPDDMFSSVYDIFLSNIPYIGDKEKGFINSKTLMDKLRLATNNVLNKGNKNIMFKDIMDELQKIQNGASAGSVVYNTIKSFFRVLNGDYHISETLDDYKELADNNDLESFTLSFNLNGEDRHIGIMTLLSPEFRSMIESKIEEIGDEELYNEFGFPNLTYTNILDTINTYEDFVSGLKQQLISTVKNQVGSATMNGNNFEVRRTGGKSAAAIDRAELTSSISATFAGDNGKIRAKAKKFLKENKNWFEKSSFLQVKNKASEMLLSIALKNTLGINITEGMAASILNSNDMVLLSELKNMFINMVSFAEGNRHIFDPVSVYGNLIDKLIELSSYSNDMRFAEMVKNVEGEFSYTNTLGSYFLTKILGPLFSKGEKLNERLLKYTNSELSPETSPLNDKTSPLLSGKFILNDIYFFDGVKSKNGGDGIRVDNIIARDKFLIMKSILYKGMDKDINEFFAFSDPLSDKIKTPFMNFSLNNSIEKNIFTVSGYDLIINEDNLFEILQDFVNYDERTSELNIKKFKDIAGKKKLSEQNNSDKKNIEALKSKLELGTEYVYKEGIYTPKSDVGYDQGARSIDDIRRQHLPSMRIFSNSIKDMFFDDSSLNMLFRDRDYSSFKKIAEAIPEAKAIFEKIIIEDEAIAAEIERRKLTGYTDDKTYLDNKKSLVRELKSIIVENDFMIEIDGKGYMMPVLEMMYWSHYIANKTMSNLLRGAQTLTKDYVEYVKRAAGMSAPGTLLINNEYRGMSDTLKTIVFNDIEDMHPLFDTFTIKATDGISILNPVFHALLRKMNGGVATNISRGSLKTVYYYYDKITDRVHYHKMNQFAISQTEYDNSDFIKSFVHETLGGSNSELYQEFITTYEATDDFNSAVNSVVKLIMDDKTQTLKEKLIHYAVFSSAVKQGKVNRIELRNSEKVSSAIVDPINYDMVTKLNTTGFRLQQITSQDTFNSKTSVPSQILNVVSALSRNSNIANNIEKALSYFSNDIRKELIDVLKDNGNTSKKYVWLKNIIINYAMQRQSNEKSVDLMIDGDVDFEIFRDKIVEILASKVRSSMRGSMPGAYHIQGVWFGNIYENSVTGEILLKKEYDALEDKRGFIARELNPLGYIREDGTFVENKEELEDLFNTFDIEAKYNDKINELKSKIQPPSSFPIKKGLEELFEENPELANEVYSALGFQGNINLESNLKNTGKTEQELVEYLKEKYPEIKLDISNNPIWEESSDIVKNQEEYNKEVNYRLKAVEILLSDKAKQIFEKGNKNGWDLNKILTELAIPKEQKQLLLDLGIRDREQLAVELASKYAFTVEMNVATEKVNRIEQGNIPYFELNGNIYTEAFGNWFKDNGKTKINYNEYQEALKEFNKSNKKEIPTQQHKNLSARDKNNDVKYEGNPDWGKLSKDIEEERERELKNESNIPTAPNGKPSRQYQEILAIVKDENEALRIYNELKELHKTKFKNSTLLDENGELLIVVHRGRKIEGGKFKQKGDEGYEVSRAEDNEGVFFSTTDSGNIYEERTEEYTFAVLNAENIYDTDKDPDDLGIITDSISKEEKTELEENGYDCAVSEKPKLVYKTSEEAKHRKNGKIGGVDEIVIFDTDKIHIIGSKPKSNRNDISNSDLTVLFNLEANKINRVNEKYDKKLQYLKDKLDSKNWSYKEIGINTPLIQNSSNDIHEPFKSTFNNTTIGHVRVWTNKKTGEAEIQELQSDLFQNKYVRSGKEEPSWNRYLLDDKGNVIDKNPNFIQEQQFLQLLNKDNNWVTFFIKATVQNFAKQGYTTIRFPKGETAAEIEGHTTIVDRLKQINEYLDRIERTKNNAISLFLTEQDRLNTVAALEKEKQELKSQGIEKLKPIEAFYEIKVGNILEKQFGKDNVKTITDEVDNEWREIEVNPTRDLANVLLQRNETNRIIGQANIKAMTVLVDAVNKKADTIPHEYAHHYIAWFRDTAIVQEGIKRFGSEEALVQAIGEQVVKQKGEAYNWWKKFTNWILNLMSDKQLLQVLTDSFLNRQDLNDFTYNEVNQQQKQRALQVYSQYVEQTGKQDIEGFKKFANNNQGKGIAPSEQLSVEQTSKFKQELDALLEKKKEEIDKAKKGGAKYKFRKAEVIMPFIYKDVYGVENGMTLSESFRFNNINLYDKTGNITYNELLKKIKDSLPKNKLAVDDFKTMMPESIFRAFERSTSGIINEHNKAIDNIKDEGDVAKAAKKDFGKTSENEIINGLVTFYFNFNRALDMFSVRIPTTGSSMGSIGRLVAFSWGVENTAYMSPKKSILDGSDYDADQLNIFFRSIDKYGRIVDSKTVDEKDYNYNESLIKKRNPLEYHQNLIFNGLEEYYENPLNKDYILQRIDLESMRNSAPQSNNNSYYNIGSFLKTHESNAAGRRIVGHFANLSTFLNNLSRSARNSGVMRYVNSVSELFNEDKENLFLDATDVITKLVNAATDNANEAGLLGRLDITEESSPLIAGFIFVYDKIRDKSLFKNRNEDITTNNLEGALYDMLKSPIVKEVIKKTKLKNSIYSDNINKVTPVSVLLGMKNTDFYKEDMLEEEKSKIRKELKELQNYAKIGEQLKRMGMVIQAYQDPGSTIQDIYAKVFDIEFAVGNRLFEGYLKTIDDKDTLSSKSFSVEDQLNFISKNLKSYIKHNQEKDIRESLNIPYILSGLSNVISQIRTISAYKSTVNSLFKATSFKYKDKKGLDAYESYITYKKGNRHVKDLEKYFKEFDAAMIGTYLDTFTNVELKIGDEVKGYDLSKIAADENGRLAYINDFIDYYYSLGASKKYKNNAFFHALKIKTTENYKIVYIEELKNQKNNIINKLKTGFILLNDEDKKAFRIYQLITNGFNNYKGSMNSVMDSVLEQEYSKHLKTIFNDFNSNQRKIMLTNIAHKSRLGLNNSRMNFNIIKGIKDEFNTEATIDFYPKKDAEAEILIYDRLDGHKMGHPVIFRKNEDGEYEVSTIDYGNPFNIHSLKSKSSYPGKFFNGFSFSDIEQMRTVDENGKQEITIKGDNFKYIDFSKNNSVKTKSMPAEGDIVILVDGTKARLTGKYLNNKDGEYYVTGTPVNVNESRVSNEANRTSIKKIEVLIDKIKRSFPNIDVQIINDRYAPIGFVKNGIVYLNEAKVQLDTPIHEIAHIFIALLKNSNTSAYDQLYLEAERMLINGNKIAIAVKKHYPNLLHDDLIEEIIVTIMGLNSVDKVKELLASQHIEQSFSEKLFSAIRDFFNNIYRFINNTFNNLIDHKGIVIDSFTDIDDLSAQLFNAIIEGKYISGITSTELTKLMPIEKQSKPISKIKTLKDNDIAIANNNISDKGSEDILISRMKQIASNNYNEDYGYFIPESYLGTEIYLGQNVHTEENENRIKDAIKNRDKSRTEKMELLIRFINSGSINEDAVSSIFGKEEDFSGEMVSSYAPGEVMKIINAMKLDSTVKVRLYSDLKNDPNYSYMYNENFLLDDYLVVIRNIEGKDVVQFYSYYNYNMNSFDHYTKGIDLLDNFISKQDSARARLKSGNTERIRLSLNMILMRNYFHSLGVEVLDMGNIFHTKNRARFDSIDQVKYSNRISKMATVPEYMDNLSEELSLLFNDKVNYSGHVDYYDVLMSFYEQNHSSIRDNKYTGYILSLNKKGESGIPTMIDLLQSRLTYLQSLNPTHNPVDYNYETKREIEFLINSIYELEFMGNVAMNERKTMSDSRRWAGSPDLIGDEYFQRLRNTLIRSDGLVVNEYEKRMEIFRGNGTEEGIFKWFENRKKERLKSYFFDVSENIFEDLFVKVKLKNEQIVNVGHIYWTTDEKLDPLYAKQAKQKLIEDPEFQKVIDRGKIIVDHIEEMLIEHIYASRQKTSIGTKKDGKLQMFTKEDAAEKLKETAFTKGRIPIITKSASAYLSQGKVGKFIKRFYQEASNINDMYEDIPFDSTDIEKETNTIKDIFIEQLGVNSYVKDTYGNLNTLETKLGYTVKDNKIVVLDADMNAGMMKDLETILNYFTMSIIRKNEYESSVLPIANGIRTLLLDDQINRNINNKVLIEYLDDYMIMAVHNRRKRMKAPILGIDIDKTTSFTMRAASSLVMTMNFNIGVLSAITNASYSFVEALTNSIAGMVGSDVYGPGLKNLTTSSMDFFTNYNLVSQLAHDYRVFNSEDYEMIEHRTHQKTKRHILSNFYINWINWATDVYARSTSLVAVMKTDGTYDAHEYNKESGTIKYNPLKDKRFFVDGKLTDSGKALAISLRKRLIIDKLQDDKNAITVDGVIMPTRAYSIKEGRKFKVYANRYIIGNYDNKSSAPLGNVFVGRLFMMFKKFAESRINAAFISKTKVDGLGKFVAYKTKDSDGKDVWLTKWEHEMVEGYLVTIKNALFDAYKAKDIHFWQKLDGSEKTNIIRGITTLSTYIFMAIIYSLLVADDWDDKEKNKNKLPPLRILKNFKYSYQSLFVLPLLLESFEHPFAAIDIVTGLFTDTFGNYKLKVPFEGQYSAMREFGNLVTGQNFVEVEKERRRKKAQELKIKRAKEALNKKLNQNN